MSAPGATLDELAAAVGGCVRCPRLVASRSRPVPGVFPAAARLLLVGEAPGAAEDVAGRPFCGRAWQLLDELLAGAGLPRAEVAVTNVVKCRPERNRTPTRTEQRACAGWLDTELALAAPELVVTLGGTAAAWAFGRPVRLADVRGRVHRLPVGRVLPTYHPSAALRFGPAGAPLAALRADLAAAAALLRVGDAGGAR